MHIEIHVSCTNYVRTLKQDKVCFGQGFKIFYFKEKKTEKGNIYVQGAGVLEIAGRKHPRCLMVKLMVVKWNLTFPPYLFFLLQKKDNSSSERHYAVFTRSFELCLLYELHQHEKTCKIYVVCRFSFKLLLCLFFFRIHVYFVLGKKNKQKITHLDYMLYKMCATFFSLE